jgi:hypothetical protein
LGFTLASQRREGLDEGENPRAVQDLGWKIREIAGHYGPVGHREGSLGRFNPYQFNVVDR